MTEIIIKSKLFFRANILWAKKFINKIWYWQDEVKIPKINWMERLDENLDHSFCR